MTSVFFTEGLAEREFGSHLLHVPTLLAWARAKGFHLSASPAIGDYEFAQVEALLCAIERHALDLSEDAALEIVLNDPALANDPVFSRRPQGEGLDPVLCRWLIGATAHHRWRQLLAQACTAGELELLDFATKMPIARPVAAVEIQQPRLPEHQRQDTRLQRLREEFGGDRVRFRGKWKTTGNGAFTNLVKALKSAGDKPFDEKSVRKDITAAAGREQNPYVKGLGGR